MADLAALLDASVIIPAPLNDTLLLAAEAELYRVYWSDDILDEVQRNLVVAGLTTPDQAAKRVAAMRRAFPLALVTRYHELIGQMTNHPKDRHVAAAAIVAGASVIVTSNRRDFPEPALSPHQIVAQSPDEFLLARDDRAPARMTAVIERQASILRQPPMTARGILDHLADHAPQFATRLLTRV